MKKYIPSEIEPKWQTRWTKDKLCKAIDHSKKPKKYVLDMFPYPSAEGLHVGHFKIYTASDILARFYRLSGFNVLHPMGWDAFGLPAENYAINSGIHPAITTATNVAHIKKQMQQVGLSYDWDREINTTDPNYYKWTQWIFLKLFKQGLAYEDEAPINWCPKDKTGLANEEVMAGKCDRCGTQVVQKNIRQWILKITKYADRLLEDLKGLDWPQSIIDMQKSWIGKSEGIALKFDGLEVFTTRVDTIFGATFVVISPEHPLLKKYIRHKKEVEEYLSLVKHKSDLERKEEKEKTGVFTGSFVNNPFTNKQIPVWIADYVLMSYGTGAIMGVPAHDQRDFEFAKKYDLEIRQVVKPDVVIDNNVAYEGEGILVNSDDYSGLSSIGARQKLSKYIVMHNLGHKQVNYHLRDWIFSRQRYWGEPIPLIHCQKCGIVPVPENELPLKLPDIEKYEPTGTGESPLAAVKDWVNTTCPKCSGLAKRETNTMPQWAGSCWYYLRFCDPKNDQNFVSTKLEKYWMNIDWYLGGAEHAVLHLLYARFWHKVLYDLGLVSTKEPFQKLSGVGLVLASDGRKMSKSLGNIVTPLDIVKEYSADTLRVFEAFMGPFENTIAWDPSSINGIYHFLKRVWNLMDKIINNDAIATTMNQNDLKLMHKTIKKVTEDIENIKFNTAIATLMEWLNYLGKKEAVNREEYKTLLLLLAPFAPHITEELWQLVRDSFQLTNNWSIHQQSWPKFDNKYLEEEAIAVVVQINGKVRDTILIQKDILNNKRRIEKMALERQKVKKFLGDSTVKNIVYVSGKVLNFVV